MRHSWQTIDSSFPPFFLCITLSGSRKVLSSGFFLRSERPPWDSPFRQLVPPFCFPDTRQTLFDWPSQITRPSSLLSSSQSFVYPNAGFRYPCCYIGSLFFPTFPFTTGRTPVRSLCHAVFNPPPHPWPTFGLALWLLSFFSLLYRLQDKIRTKPPNPPVHSLWKNFVSLEFLKSV